MTPHTKCSHEAKLISRRDFLKHTALTATFVSMGCGIEGVWPKAAISQSSSGTINVVVTEDMDTYDVHSSIAGVARQIPFHIFECLVTRDREPMLATSWENPSKLAWIFHLRQGVEFTNGESFDSSVVKYNLERYLAPETKARLRGLLKPVESVQVVDKYTVRINTATPFATFPYVLCEIPMMSPKAIKEMGKDVARKPIGTGPFLLKEWVPLERTVIEANPSFHGTKPKAKTIIWKPITEASARIVELRAGKADLIQAVPPQLMEQISGEGMEVVRKRSLYRMIIKLNCTRPPFNDKRVRQAINYAVNKADIIQYVLRGVGDISTDPLGPDRMGHNPNLKPYPRDPQMSKKLLAEAGFPNGADIEIITPAGRYLGDKEVVEAISFQVKEAGFNMKVRLLEWGMFLKSFKEGNGYFIGDAYSDPQQMFYGTGDSKAFSWVGYQNDEWIKLYNEASETFDVKKRGEIYEKMGRIEWDDPPALWLYHTQEIYGLRTRLKNFTPRADAFILLRGAYVE